MAGGCKDREPQVTVARGLETVVERPSRNLLAQLASGPPHLELLALRIGYGAMTVVHDIDLVVGRGQSLCLIGSNGAGKSTILNGIFGLADIMSGSVVVAGRDVTRAPAAHLLSQTKLAYVLQSNSVFPDMTVEENLLLGGYLLPSRSQTTAGVERIFDSRPQLAKLRKVPAGALSGGERRILEISRALIPDPDILLLDEPSIGLEPRAVDEIFEMLRTLLRDQRKTIVIVEQNIKKGLEFADIGYVLSAGRVALAGPAKLVLKHPRVGRLFLGE
jgi:branched-chain amino acid transport system ATP-binding protein